MILTEIDGEKIWHNGSLKAGFVAIFSNDL